MRAPGLDEVALGYLLLFLSKKSSLCSCALRWDLERIVETLGVFLLYGQTKMKSFVDYNIAIYSTSEIISATLLLISTFFKSFIWCVLKLCFTHES